MISIEMPKSEASTITVNMVGGGRHDISYNPKVKFMCLGSYRDTKFLGVIEKIKTLPFHSQNSDRKIELTFVNFNITGYDEHLEYNNSIKFICEATDFMITKDTLDIDNMNWLEMQSLSYERSDWVAKMSLT